MRYLDEDNPRLGVAPLLASVAGVLLILGVAPLVSFMGSSQTSDATTKTPPKDAAGQLGASASGDLRPNTGRPNTGRLAGSFAQHPQSQQFTQVDKHVAPTRQTATPPSANPPSANPPSANPAASSPPRTTPPRTTPLVRPASHSTKSTAAFSHNTTPSRETAPSGQTTRNSAAFFPQITGKRVVFLVDRSVSMGRNNRLERAKSQILARLRAAPEHTEFAILFFGSRVDWLGDASAPVMHRRSEENMTLVAQELASIEPGGSARPLSALRDAFKLKPDEIFLITDAEFDYSTDDQETLNHLNAGQSRIHGTFVHDSAPMSQPVSDIAKDHNGVATLVIDRTPDP